MYMNSETTATKPVGFRKKDAPQAFLQHYPPLGQARAKHPDQKRNAIMNHPAPHYINEDGNLVSGPFSSREDYLKLYCDQTPEGIVTLAECNRLANVTSPAAASSSRQASSPGSDVTTNPRN
jgi:hypothetical protein